MLRVLNDPLLAVTQGLLRFIYMALFAITALLAIAACVGLLSGDQVSQYSTVTAAQRHGVVLILLVIPSLALFGWFVRILRQIVGTVAERTPFIAENAGRLARMGWLALALKGISIAAHWVLADLLALNKVALPDGGIVLALTLFILARVFRQGAAMREDLEGTV